MRETQSTRRYAASEQSPLAISLHLSHEQLAVMLAGIADGITALNSAGELVYGNDTAARLIGYASAQALLAASNADILSKFEIFDEAGHALPSNEPARPSRPARAD